MASSSSYYYPTQQRPIPTMQHLSSSSSSSSSSHPNHVGRTRRGARLSSTQTAHKPFRGVRSMKELTEAASVAAFRTRFEAGRSFDLDDDMEFCPALLTEDDLNYMSSPSSSDRSSLSSNSPESSPMQQQVRPTQAVAPPPAPALHHHHHHHQLSHAAPHFQTAAQMKLHQPAAARVRNAIPIVNPTTGMRLPSRPESISPGLGSFNRRW